MKTRKLIFTLIVFWLVIIICSYFFYLTHFKRTRIQPNILLIVIDALRKDHLGCYGYHRDTSPNIDAIAANGTIFSEAISHGSNTILSVPSLLTGRYPSEHGVLWSNRKDEIWVGPPLSLPTIADILGEAGYATCGISGSPIVGFGTNTNRGFEHFDQSCGKISVWQQKSAKDLNRRAFKCLDKYRSNPNPFFLYMHYMDPHNYYKPPNEFIIFGSPGYSEEDEIINRKMNKLAQKVGVASITEDKLQEWDISLADI
ncbi:MAG: sulfatase, partial [Fidelibacterota bacterium]